MEMFFQGFNLLCSGSAFVMVIFAVIKFRKERLFKPLALIISLLISVILLPIYLSISGIHLSFFLRFLAFFLGFGLGIISGVTAKLRQSKPGIIGKQSRIAFLIWGLSLVFSMLMNLSSSPTVSALGALPLIFTTWIQVSANLVLLFRTIKLSRAKPARAAN